MLAQVLYLISTDAGISLGVPNATTSRGRIAVWRAGVDDHIARAEAVFLAPCTSGMFGAVGGTVKEAAPIELQTAIAICLAATNRGALSKGVGLTALVLWVVTITGLTGRPHLTHWVGLTCLRVVVVVGTEIADGKART